MGELSERIKEWGRLFAEPDIEKMGDEVAQLEEENQLLGMALQFYQVGRVPSVASNDATTNEIDTGETK